MLKRIRALWGGAKAIVRGRLHWGITAQRTPHVKDGDHNEGADSLQRWGSTPGYVAKGGSRGAVKLPPRELAAHLIDHLDRCGWDSALSVKEMRGAYHAMCLDRGLAVRPWNPVAAELTLMTTGEKVYGSYIDPRTRSRRRPRIYPPGDRDVDITLFRKSYTRVP